MHREPLLSLLHQYNPIDSNERAMWLDTIAFVEQQPSCFERSLAMGHITGSAWIVSSNATPANRQQTVLIHHRKLDRWFQPGGHADGNPDVAAVAMQEAQEETGLSGLRFAGNPGEPPAIFDVDVHLIPARPDEPAHFHYDIRFLIEADPNEPFVESGETKAIQWVRLEDIPTFTEETSIQRMIEKSVFLAKTN
ncbi:MAG: NUDIX hydrolase [Rudanella sp.]|nr:NUDIX hydrolase [Rudanella sp.]